MRFVKVTDGVPERFNLGSLRKTFPNTSFPKNLSNLSDDTLERFGIYRVAQVPKPAGEVVTEVLPQKINGIWTQQWETRDETAEEQAARLADKRARTSAPLRNLRLALISLGFAGEVNTAIQALSGEQKARLEIELEYSNIVERNAVWVNFLFKNKMSKTDAQIDALFEQAQGE